MYVSCLSPAPRQPCCPGRWATGSPGCEHIGFSLWLRQGWEASSGQRQAPVFLLQQHLGTMTSLQYPGGKLLGKRNQTTGVLCEHWMSLSVFLSYSPQAAQAWDRAFQGETDRGYSCLLYLKGFDWSVPLRNPVSVGIWSPIESLNCAQNLQGTLLHIASSLSALLSGTVGGKARIPVVPWGASSRDYMEGMGLELEDRESSSGFASGVQASVHSILGWEK